MNYRLECAGSFSSKDVNEADIQRAFDDDAGRGEFAILVAPDGSYMQTAGEGDGPYVLEHRDGATEKHMKAKGQLTKAEVRDAFVQFLQGDRAWRKRREWETLEESRGCLTVAMVALVLVVSHAVFA